jgi:hypothetical protein
MGAELHNVVGAWVDATDYGFAVYILASEQIGGYMNIAAGGSLTLLCIGLCEISLELALHNSRNEFFKPL